jgi:hypothetical protein
MGESANKSGFLPFNYWGAAPLNDSETHIFRAKIVLFQPVAIAKTGRRDSDICARVRNTLRGCQHRGGPGLIAES